MSVVDCAELTLRLCQMAPGDEVRLCSPPPPLVSCPAPFRASIKPNSLRKSERRSHVNCTATLFFRSAPCEPAGCFPPNERKGRGGSQSGQRTEDPAAVSREGRTVASRQQGAAEAGGDAAAGQQGGVVGCSS